MLAPHLPSPSCNIKNHERWINIKIILAASFIGLIAGLSGASIVLGWIWPNYGGGDTWIVSRNQTGSTAATLEEIVQKESNDRIFSVYRASAKLDNLDYLPFNERIGEAVAISSDGWLAMYIKEGSPLITATKLRVLSNDGAVFQANKYLFDSQSRVAYIKISREAKIESGESATQFKVASFEDGDMAYQEIFVHENLGWRYSKVGYKKYFAPSASRLDSAPSHAFTVEDDFSAGSVAITGRGRVIGFINEDNELLPIFALTRIMPGVLSQGKIEYPSFGASGWFSAVQPALFGNSQVTGFVVAGVWSKSSKLKRGDVITEINGQIVHDESLWYNTGGKQATLTVTRAGKTLDLTVDIIKTSPVLK